MQSINPLVNLREQGQAVWLDYIRRDILLGGELERLVKEEGVSGVTSNPAIFAEAIGNSDVYDEAIAEFLALNPRSSAVELYESLAVEDIRLASDILEPAWSGSGGADGHVSLEVSPHLARDTEGSVEEARRLWSRVDRPNLLIKIPATKEGLPAIERLLSEGINVNVTLMFSLEHYEEVAQAYIRASRKAADPAIMASVASFFVSRVDSAVDALLDRLGSQKAMDLKGRIAVDNAKLAYCRFQELFLGETFSESKGRGARPQRVLWASTSTKNPEYNDVLYVEELIGPQTVNTMPPETLEAFRDHGKVRRSLDVDLEGAKARVAQLQSLGIDLHSVTEQLQEEGVRKFAQPFDKLMATLEQKRASLIDSAP